MLASMHPLGLTDDWSDKLRGQSFSDEAAGITYEHYMQVVLTTVEPRRRPELQYDAYEYTVQSHKYNAGALCCAVPLLAGALPPCAA